MSSLFYIIIIIIFSTLNFVHSWTLTETTSTTTLNVTASLQKTQSVFSSYNPKATLQAFNQQKQKQTQTHPYPSHLSYILELLFFAGLHTLTLSTSAPPIWGWIGRDEIRERRRWVVLDEKKCRRFEVVGVRLSGSCMVLAVIWGFCLERQTEIKQAEVEKQTWEEKSLMNVIIFGLYIKPV